MLPREVDAAGQLGAQRRVADAVGRGRLVRAVQRPARIGARAADQVGCRRRAPTARQAGAPLVAAGRIGPEDRVQQRRPHAMPVAHARSVAEQRVGLAGGLDALPAQPGLHAPAARRAPLVLQVGRRARAARLQLGAEIGQQRHAALQQAARFAPALQLELGAGDELVHRIRRRRAQPRRGGLHAAARRPRRRLVAAFVGAGLAPGSAATAPRCGIARRRRIGLVASEQQRPFGAQGQARLRAAAHVVDAARRQRVLGVVELVAPARAARLPAPEVRAELGARPRGQPFAPLRVQPPRGEPALAFGPRQLVRRNAGDRLPGAARAVLVAGVEHAGRDRQRFARLAQPPLQPRAGVHAATQALRQPRLAPQIDHLGAGLVLGAGRDLGRAARAALEDRPREVPAQAGAGVVACPGQARRQFAALAVDPDAQLVDALAQRLAQHDIDRAGDRARAGLGGRRAQDLDALDQLGRDLLEREAGRDRLAVDQQPRVAAAQPAHPRRAAAARRAAGRDPRQAAQHLAQAAVAEGLDLLPVDDDLGRGRAPARRVGVVAAAGDLDALRRFGRGGRLGLPRSLLRGTGRPGADRVRPHLVSRAGRRAQRQHGEDGGRQRGGHPARRRRFGSARYRRGGHEASC